MVLFLTSCGLHSGTLTPPQLMEKHKLPRPLQWCCKQFGHVLYPLRLKTSSYSSTVFLSVNWHAYPSFTLTQTERPAATNHREKNYLAQKVQQARRGTGCRRVEAVTGTDPTEASSLLAPIPHSPFSSLVAFKFYSLFQWDLGTEFEVDVIEVPEANFDSSASKENNYPNLLCHPASPLTMEFHWAQRMHWRRSLLWCCIHVVLCEKCLPRFPFSSLPSHLF